MYLNIYTTQLDKYTGDDLLNIALDSDNNVFAPTLELEQSLRNGTIAWDVYKEQYRELMRASYKTHRDTWQAILKRRTVTFACSCKPGEPCHRNALPEFFKVLGPKAGVAVLIKGERSLLPTKQPENKHAICPHIDNHEENKEHCLYCWEVKCINIEKYKLDKTTGEIISGPELPSAEPSAVIE